MSRLGVVGMKGGPSQPADARTPTAHPPATPLHWQDEEEDQGLLGWSGPPGRQQQYALPGPQEPLALQSRVSKCAVRT